MDIKEAELFKGAIADHFYYRAKLAAVKTLIDSFSPKRILDVGAGTGFFSESLLKQTSAAEATCVDTGYASDSERLVEGKPLFYRRHVDHSAADLVLMMDVAEHVADDFALIKEYADKVTSGTHFVITVPAFQWLWSDHDVFLEHYRRYDLAAIEDVVSRAGLSIKQGCYFYLALLPFVIPTRFARNLFASGASTPQSQMRELPAVINAVLWSACRLELYVFRSNRWGGLTAVVHAVKP